MRFGLFLFLSLTLVSALSSCVQAPIIGPDGTPHELISCYSISQCYAQARERCQGNYKIVNTTNENHGSTGSDVSTTHDMLVKCDRDTK